MNSLATWSIPALDGSSSPLSLSAGETAVFVGANGTGKSALSHWLHKNIPGNVPIVRILAHRRLWMSSSGPDTTPSNFETFSTLLTRNDLKPDSRYKDQSADQRSAGILFRLMSVEGRRNFQASRLKEGIPIDETVDPSPLDRISRLLQTAGFGLTFQVGSNMSFEVERDGHLYPIEQMSDGEKAAFILGTEVVLAEAGSVIILDEPERHLHRSISGRLIIAMVAERPDCGFVVFTHDLDLADRLRHKSAQATIVRSVAWDEAEASAWDLEELPPQAQLPEEARQAILGGRDQILFVEGTAASLDSSLYEILFPEWLIQPGGSCREVIQSVSSLRLSDKLHWITAVGIVDGDARTEEEAKKLAEQKVLALPVNEVESLYFVPKVLRKMAECQARHLHLSAETLFNDAQQAGIKKITDSNVQTRLAAANSEKILHRMVQSESPSKKDIPTAGSAICLNIVSPYQDQFDDVARAVKDSNWEALVTAYSVRDSPALDAIAKALKYPNRSTYQQAVLARLRDDADFSADLRATLGTLSDLQPQGVSNLV